MPDEIDRLEKEVMKREEEERGLASAVIYVDQLKLVELLKYKERIFCV